MTQEQAPANLTDPAEPAPGRGDTNGRTFAERMRDDFVRVTQEKSREWTETILVRLRQLRQGGAPIDRVPDRMRRSADQLELCIELIQDMRSGRYRDISWPAALAVSAAILYAVSPADLVPDVLPVLGSIDDAIVLSLAVSLASRELRRYCEFKNYDPMRYFPNHSDPPHPPSVGTA